MKITVQISMEEQRSLEDIPDLGDWLDSLISNSYAFTHYGEDQYELDIEVEVEPW